MIDWREVKAATKKEQAAALCCRISSLGEFQVLLISSLETNRWILPKGNIEFKEKAYRCAQREAFEEAGVEGKIKKRPLGCYRYLKDGGIDTEVSVHLLRLILEQDIYPETGLRQKLWTSPAKAADLVLEPDLAEIIATFTDLTKLVSQDRNILRKSALKKCSRYWIDLALPRHLNLVASRSLKFPTTFLR